MIELTEDASRQYIDACSVFTAYEEAREHAKAVRGGMYWHKGPPSAPEQEYLVRTSARGSETSLGPKSEETLGIYAAFQARKMALEERASSLAETLATHKRMNKALRVGRAPNIVVDLLNKLEDSGLSSYFRVVGTHALYAYESEAGVRVDNDAVATRDIDLLWDVRKHLKFATSLERLDSSMIGLLQKVDKTFKIRDSQKYTAVNASGFEVDIIRRNQTAKDPHPYRLSSNEDDFWVAQANRAGELLDSPGFNSIVVGVNGNMARMRTLDPRAFVRFKEWMAGLSEREPLKRRRDQLQAEVVTKMVADYLPHLK